MFARQMVAARVGAHRLVAFAFAMLLMPAHTSTAGPATFSAIGSLIVMRFFHTATGNGEVLIAGGETANGPSATAELYDPASGKFSTVAEQMHVARYQHTATMLPNGKVLIAGGVSTNGATDTAELFDPATNTFALLAIVRGKGKTAGVGLVEGYSLR